MTYAKTLEYLFQQLPMFHRIGPAAYKADLNNTIAICNYLKHPERKFKSVHVAGTNGKGSSSHMLAAVLQQCGYKTGLYTSPHLVDFRERIRVNGKMIPKKNVTDFVEEHRAEFEKIRPSFFEWTVGLAFDYFAKEKVDIAIIEVGLGGRLDSTNVIQPLVSLITNIGYDHTNLLGDTLQKIAAEKAGIIKSKTPVIISERQKETENVFSRKAKKESAPIIFSQDDYLCFYHRWKEDHAEVSVLKKSTADFKIYRLDLTGEYQRKNLSGVLSVLDVLKTKKFRISEHAVAVALANVKKLTGLRGRFEVLKKDPTVICDTGHNAEGISEVMSMIEKIPHKKLHIVLGVVNDKDPAKILKLLPPNAKFYFTRAAIPRALNQKELHSIAKKFGLKGASFANVISAYEAAVKRADKKDLIYVGGSTFVVADLLSSIK